MQAKEAVVVVQLVKLLLVVLTSISEGQFDESWLLHL